MFSLIIGKNFDGLHWYAYQEYTYMIIMSTKEIDRFSVYVNVIHNIQTEHDTLFLQFNSRHFLKCFDFYKQK